MDTAVLHGEAGQRKGVDWYIDRSRNRNSQRMVNGSESIQNSTRLRVYLVLCIQPQHGHQPAYLQHSNAHAEYISRYLNTPTLPELS